MWGGDKEKKVNAKVGKNNRMGTCGVKKKVVGRSGRKLRSEEKLPGNTNPSPHFLIRVSRMELKKNE